jgi:GNAT superfamily N-acetyltransferase
MYELLMMMFHQVRECLMWESFSDLVRRRIFWKRIQVPVEMDLTQEISFLGHINPTFVFKELTLSDIEENKWSFAVPSRQYKASRNLKKGFRGFAILEDNTIVGDVWCTASDESGNPIHDTDSEMHGIHYGVWEAYAFDMLIDPGYRGKNLAVPLHRFLHSTLKKEGYTKVFGGYWQDNIQALWMHRMLKFKEHPRREVTRFLMFLHAKDYEIVSKQVPHLEDIISTPKFCWEYKQCDDETRDACVAYIETEQQCWELFKVNGQLRECCIDCEFRRTQVSTIKITT